MPAKTREQKRAEMEAPPAPSSIVYVEEPEEDPAMGDQSPIEAAVGSVLARSNVTPVRINALRQFDQGRLVYVDCPLPGYEGLRVGYRVNNKFDVAERFRNAPLESRGLTFLVLAAQFIRVIEGWNFGRPMMREELGDVWEEVEEPVLENGAPVLDEETGQPKVEKKLALVKRPVWTPVLDEEGAPVLEPIPCPDPNKPASLNVIIENDIELWRWIRWDGYEEALHGPIKNS